MAGIGRQGGDGRPETVKVRTRSRWRGLWVTALAVAGLNATSADACVVGTGLVGSCTEVALDACLPTGAGFDGSVTFDCGGAATITLTGSKAISSNTAIDGGGSVTLSGNDAVQIFVVNNGVTLSLDNLTLSNGRIVASPTARGGAIYSDGTVNVTNCIFANNRAMSDGASMAVAWAFGGAIFTDGNGSLTVVDSTFTGNSATVTGSGLAFAAGGALYGNSAPVSITGSTLVDNAVAAAGFTILGNAGGAIYQTGHTLTVANSTFVGNSVSGVMARGGAVHAVSTSAGLTNCTFRQAANGSGASLYSTTAVMTLTNTIVAGATDNCATGPSTSIVDGGHNIDDGSSCGFTGTNCSDTSGTSFCATDPQLDPAGLASNGGPTQTIALCNDSSPAGCSADSPAINAGDQAVCAAAPVNGVDQRGVTRPGESNPSCCIGAFEIGSLAPDTPTATSSATPSSTPTATATATGTATASGTPPSTATATHTPTPQPDGTLCDDPNQCQSTFCADGVCCSSACNAPADRCDVPGQLGVCVNLAAPAPTLDRSGLITGALLLASIAALALRRRRAR